jgi:TetR/AcrR family transcriptional repressor of nem operon
VPRTREFDTEAAVGAAMELFWAQGYEATSVDDLVARLGIGRGSLYAAFGSKHALYLRALDRYRCEQMGGALAALDDPDALLRPTLRGFFDALVDDAVADAAGLAVGGRSRAARAGRPPGCFMVNATTERAACDREVAARVRENLAAMEGALERAVRRAQGRGEVPAGKDARALARFLAMAVQGLRVAGAANPSRAALRDMVRVTLAALE